MRAYELITNHDGAILVRYADGRMLSVGDGCSDEAYNFVVEYLGKMCAHYRTHLMAADLLLKRQMSAAEYSALKADVRSYNIRLALQSMHCVFGAIDNVPDCDNVGNFNVEFVACPLRATCPYNGYRHTDKPIVCCNPVYDTGLTRRQAEVANLLVNTSYTIDDIATALCLSHNTVRNTSSEVYTAMGVANRQALTLLLKNKRLK